MSIKEWIVVLIVAPLLVVALLAGMWFALVYVPGADTLWPSGKAQKYDCTEEDQTGVCGIRHFFKGEY